MACCGKGAGASVQYEAKGTNGTTKLVASVAEAKIFLATAGGGTYKAVPKPAPKSK